PIAITFKFPESAIGAVSRAKVLLANAVSELQPIRNAGLQIAVTEALLNVRIVVSDALAMRRVVLPAISDVAGSVIDIDVTVAPVAAAAPVVAPASDRPARTEGQTGRDDAGADRARITKVVRRIVRVGPSSVDGRRLVVRHVHRPRLGRLDDDHLLVFLGLNADFLLLRRDELLVVISLGAQPLDRIHHVRLLREYGIAEALGPVDLVAHHRYDVCGAR